jgi:four helix bundle protein
MEDHPYVRNYRELIVYKKASTLADFIFQISKGFPTEEQYSLTRQVRRASRSIGAQIAEAWAKRLYKKHFISKLTDADAELNETEHWIITAHSCGYIPDDIRKKLVKECRELGRIIGGMIIKADKFCQK